MGDATSDEIWILAANHMMAKALEVRRWVEVFAAHGVTLTPRVVTDLRFVTGTSGLRVLDARGDEIAAPRLCLVRTYERQAPRHLELMGATCLVSARMVDLCFDKALVAQMVAGTGVPMVESEIVASFGTEASRSLTSRELPLVLKPASGRGGHGVELARDEAELSYRLDGLTGRPGIVQPLVDGGHDVRVYVIGGMPRYAMERIGPAGDFRSNYSLGGTARRFELTDELADYATRVAAALPDLLAFGSVDFCFDSGQPVFCEVNANLGCHIPYEFANIDLIGDYADWVRATFVEGV